MPSNGDFYRPISFIKVKYSVLFTLERLVRGDFCSNDRVIKRKYDFYNTKLEWDYPTKGFRYRRLEFIARHLVIRLKESMEVRVLDNRLGKDARVPAGNVTVIKCDVRNLYFFTITTKNVDLIFYQAA